MLTSNIAHISARENFRCFFRILHSRFSLTFSARNRDRSICSRVTTLIAATVSLLAAAIFTQLRSVCSTSPSSFAIKTIYFPIFTCLTACSLNSTVYSCFGIFLTNVTLIVCHIWKTIFRGTLSMSLFR